jgi:hypothetical protein
MANRLKMATIDSLQTLHQRGWSIRRIARALGIHRDTVARHLRQSNQAGAPTGSAHAPAGQAGIAAEPGKIGQAPAGSEAGVAVPGEAESAAACVSAVCRQASLCQPFDAVIVAKWDLGLTAQRIY